ncbi:hypothetical protein LTR37_001021 [Vermiconidia calcicola]|uniref:Uncharacterized protein n=1 Tax=Vermiconidia calcicola TaxID=1690605 RepID=A0ACC3NW95_9PEZI|nr:hypothetical protein LTR37_001021 [Vermiconidia calcicola]
MVLHLLGKKSWNVYNNDNVARVRRDEEDAKLREEAEEQRMQEADAERRIAILRGEEPRPLSPPAAEGEDGKSRERKRRREDDPPRKRRRLRDEDDTDRDIRYAREDAEAGAKAKQTLRKGGDDQDAPLLDHAGHLQLVPAPDEKSIRKAEKNAEVEAEKAKKRKREEDQVTMRFSNAAGFKQGLEKPWYAAAQKVDEESKAVVLADVHEKDVWGNEDPRRKQREQNRISSNDPFAAMQHAQRQLKQSERDRERWQKERMVEIEQLERAEARKRRHEKKHRGRDEDDDSLEGFSLDPQMRAEVVREIGIGRGRSIMNEKSRKDSWLAGMPYEQKHESYEK